MFIVDHTVFRFDLYFRKNPFAGEFTIFGGLEECIRFIANFKLKEEEIRFLRAALPTCEVGMPIF
jgi:nicotinate phosphoribosyltransferase